jgi:hypothetical protein
VKRRQRVSACVPLHLRLQKRMPQRGQVYLRRHATATSEAKRVVSGARREDSRAKHARAHTTRAKRGVGTHGAWKPHTEHSLRGVAVRGGPISARK